MKLLNSTLKRIVPADAAMRAAARQRLQQLAIPVGALGRLLELAEDLAAMTGSLQPVVSRKRVVVMAGDHGIAAEGVSLFPQSVTVEMVRNFLAGGACINALARSVGAEVTVVDIGVAADLSDLTDAGLVSRHKVCCGTANFAHEPAMSREQAVAGIEAGIRVAQELAETTDLFATGEMGIANTTPSSALVAAFCRTDAARVTGRGTGLDDEQLRHKAAVIDRALALHNPDPADPVGLLAKVGGAEIGAIAGLILGAAAERRPVLIDGFISTAGALVAQALAPVSTDYMIAAHRSVEQGHVLALQRLGKQPLLDLGLRLGEGTGAAMAMPIIDAARAVLTEVATFAEASVSSAKG